jgi:hypothetical protein
MNNTKVLPYCGLIASSVLFISYLVLLVVLIINNTASHLAGIFRLFTPLLALCIFLALRDILVNSSKLNNFKIVINLMIILQILLFIMVLILKFNIISVEVIIPVTILGVVQLALYIWFFILIFMVKNSELEGISLLKYSIIIILIFSLGEAVLQLIDDEKFGYLNQLLKIIKGLPAIILVYFFYKNLRLKL